MGGLLHQEERRRMACKGKKKENSGFLFLGRASLLYCEDGESEDSLGES